MTGAKPARDTKEFFSARNCTAGRRLLYERIPRKVAQKRESPVAVQISPLAHEVALRVAVMPDGEARQRYHQLVDRELLERLSPLERFELERIEARLEALDRDPAIEAQDREWESRRERLLDSMHELLLQLQR